MLSGPGRRDGWIREDFPKVLVFELEGEAGLGKWPSRRRPVAETAGDLRVRGQRVLKAQMAGMEIWILSFEGAILKRSYGHESHDAFKQTS